MSQMEKNVLLSFYSPFAAICMCPPYMPAFSLQFSTLVADRGVPLSWVYGSGYVLPDTVQDDTRHYKEQEKSVIEREANFNGLSYFKINRSEILYLR